MKKKDIPAVISIVAIISCMVSTWSADAANSEISELEALLNTRTSIMQNYFYGELSLEDAERMLQKIETQPLLAEDITYLRDVPPSQIDIVKKMSVKRIDKIKTILDYKTYKAVIVWDMQGLSSNYTTACDYYVVLKTSGNAQFISKLEPDNE